MRALSEEQVTRILTAAVAAPSGDNSQPWSFVFRAPNTLEFHALPEKDNELLNVDASGTLIALGAALENAALEAKAMGFGSEIRYSEESSLVATLALREDGKLSPEEQVLREAIPLRHTNRKAYRTVALKEEDRKALLDAALPSSVASLILIEDKGVMRRISRALTSMEEVALQNEAIHKLFFESIFWSKECNAVGESGLYIRTLELPPPARLLFRALRHWSVARSLARIKFPRLVALMNAKQNASASAFGVITVSGFSRAHYVEAGRLLERAWLAATARGMSLQIVTGLLFLARTMEQGESSIFSAAERALVKDASALIQGQLKGAEEPFLTFRVGYGAGPSAVSHRRPPEIAYAP